MHARVHLEAFRSPLQISAWADAINPRYRDLAVEFSLWGRATLMSNNWVSFGAEFGVLPLTRCADEIFRRSSRRLL
jgi:hypothetical protein